MKQQQSFPIPIQDDMELGDVALPAWAGGSSYAIEHP